jgi:hypothetical protein
VKVNHILEDYIASIFMVEEKANQETSMKLAASKAKLHAGVILAYSSTLKMVTIPY